ncbi:MAG: hypothetical protein SGI74_12555 [Oligoflexia bacterium]|nr:hypothetical protein [Oligoflexia bacterium]
MKVANSMRSLLALMLLVSVSVACTGKGKALGASSKPTPLATATPSPSATATPVPTIEPEPTGCLKEIPSEPVPIVNNASCTQGYVRAEYNDGRKTYKLCVAKSACEVAKHENFRCLPGDYPEITKDCHPLPEMVDYENRYRHWVIDEASGLVDDGARGMYDALGRRVLNGRVTNDWGWTGTCAPKICPPKQTNKQCVNPAPPPLHHMRVEASGQGSDGKYRFDSTPIVCDGPVGSPTANYCSTVWNGEKTGCCPVRRNSDPLRKTCDLELTGSNTLNGDVGPVWSTTYGGEIFPTSSPFMIYVDWFNPNYPVDVYSCGNRIGTKPGVCNGIRLGQ